MMTKEKQITHAGHRQRLRDNIQNTGMFNINDIHFLEYLLTFTITRRDTNPIAHELLEKFGSISEIFNANISALMDINGVGEKTARFLNYMSVTSYMYNKSLINKKEKLDTLKKIVCYLQKIIPPSDTEQFIVVIVNKNYTVKQYKLFKGVSHSLISINANELTDYLIKNKAYFCIFAHTHPNSSSTPSNKDIEMFNSFITLLNALSISLIDNLILGDDNYYSSKQNKFFPYLNNNDTNI